MKQLHYILSQPRTWFGQWRQTLIVIGSALLPFPMGLFQPYLIELMHHTPIVQKNTSNRLVMIFYFNVMFELRVVILKIYNDQNHFRQFYNDDLKNVFLCTVYNKRCYFFHTRTKQSWNWSLRSCAPRPGFDRTRRKVTSWMILSAKGQVLL